MAILLNISSPEAMKGNSEGNRRGQLKFFGQFSELVASFIRLIQNCSFTDPIKQHPLPIYSLLTSATAVVTLTLLTALRAAKVADAWTNNGNPPVAHGKRAP